MLVDPSIIADGNEGRIHKTDPGTRPKATEQIQTQPAQQAWHSLHKPSIADEMWKLSLQIHLHMLLILGFEVSVLALMKVDHNRQRFTVTQSPSSLASVPPITQQPSNLLFRHALAEIIDSTE